MTKATTQKLIVCTNRLVQLLSVMTLAAFTLLGIKMYSVLVAPIDPSIRSYITVPLLIFLCVGLFFLKQLFIQRIRVISDTAKDIIRTGDLSKRIPVDTRWEDLSTLSFTLNSMLAEIERSVGAIRTVSDNIAHDLRTPLTRLRNHIEDMRMNATHAATAEQQQERYRQLVTECDALLATFQALLRISNIESGHKHSEFCALNLGDVLKDVVELYEPLAAQKTITLTFDIAPGVALLGDKDLLFQAFANLVDNAIKYTPEYGAVHLTLQPLGDAEHRAIFTLRDSGIGIADADKPNVMRRFYRVEQSRHQPGCGLGLSLVAAIISVHKGSLTLTDNQPSGLVVTVTL